MSNRYTFDVVHDGDEGAVWTSITIEAADAFAAWRRIGGQLVNQRETDNHLPLSIRLRDTPDMDGPVLGKSGRRAKLK